MTHSLPQTLTQFTSKAEPRSSPDLASIYAENPLGKGPKSGLSSSLPESPVSITSAKYQVYPAGC